MILDVVRHGESEMNVQGRYAGSTDTPLTARGIQQAEALAERQRGEKYDLVVTSPLQRARATAELVHRGRNIPLVIIEEFAERCVGVYEGLTRGEAEQNYPELWHSNALHQVDFAPSGGESLRQLSERLEIGLKRLMREHAAGHVLLVCHGAVARELNRRFNNLSYEAMNDFTLGNCEVVRYELLGV